jgi:hypothetical protein
MRYELQNGRLYPKHDEARVVETRLQLKWTKVVLYYTNGWMKKIKGIKEAQLH